MSCSAKILELFGQRQVDADVWVQDVFAEPTKDMDCITSRGDARLIT